MTSRARTCWAFCTAATPLTAWPPRAIGDPPGHRLDIIQKNSRPNHPTTCGNHRRPHRSLPHRTTPATAYTARPKATPSTDRTGEVHHRVRTDKVDHTGVVTLRVNGRLHHIGIGRTHARTHVLLLIHDLHITVINAATGELLRELTLDPTKDYQPHGLPPGPSPKNT